MMYIQTRETQENVLLTPLTFIGTDDFSFLFGHWIHAMGVQKYVSYFFKIGEIGRST